MEKWAGVVDDGRKLPLIFVEIGVKINKWVYKDMLEAQVVPWLQNTYGNQPYTVEAAYCGHLGPGTSVRIIRIVPYCPE